MNIHRDTTVTVTRTGLDELPPVSLNVFTGTAHVGIYLMPDEARTLAAELVAMADSSEVSAAPTAALS